MTEILMLEEPHHPGETTKSQITDLVIQLTVLGLFTYASLTLIAPFFPILVWAIILTVALYPVYAWLAARLGGRPKIAAFLVTLVAFAIVSGPLGMLAGSLTGTLLETVTEIRAGTFRLPLPPEGVRDWPLVGRGIEEVWTLAATNVQAALAEYGPALRPYVTSMIGDVAEHRRGSPSVPRLDHPCGIPVRSGSAHRCGRATVRGPHRAAAGRALRRSRRRHDPRRVARRRRRRLPAGAARRHHLLGRGRSGARPARLRRPRALHRPDRSGLGPAAGHHLGLDDDDDRGGAGADGLPRADPRHRQRAQAAADRARPDHAGAGDPDRRDRRHHRLWPDGPVPRPDRARRLLRAGRGLGAAGIVESSPRLPRTASRPPHPFDRCRS